MPIFRVCAVAGAAAWLVACGGGGAADDGSGAPPPDAGTPPAALASSAVGTSASTVSVSWAAVPAATGYAVRRQQGGGEWQTVAELPAGSTEHVDTGLAPKTAYRYRVQALGPATAQGDTLQASTTEDELVTTAAGALGEELARATLGAEGGRVSSEAAGVVVDVPAGAFAAPATVVLRRQASTAPGALGEGVQIETDATPARALQVQLDYAAGANADGLGLALRRDDGSWLLMPTTRHDRAARRLGAALPAPAAAAQRTAKAVHHTYTVERVEAIYLAPAQAQLPVNRSITLTPYARVLVKDVECWVISVECVTIDPAPHSKPVLKPRVLPLNNDKPGYTRQWLVEQVPGGNATLGSVGRKQDAGGLYTAPPRAPAPNPVTVSFRSRHDASGQQIELNAKLTVQEPVWTGSVDGAIDGAADLGFVMSAQAVWGLVSASNVVQTFTAAGTQSLHVVEITCTGSASPSSVALPPGLLKVDWVSEPARYSLDVGSLWNTTITGSCPRGRSMSVPMQVPGQLVVEGALSDDNTRIRGNAHFNNISWQWDFKVQY